MKRIFMGLIYALIPVLTVLLCLILQLAQGEKTEEILFGLEVGLLIDLILLLVMRLTERIRGKKEARTNQQR